MAVSFDTSICKLTNNFNRSIRQMAGDEMEQFAGQLKELHKDYVEAQRQIIADKGEFLSKALDHSVNALNQTKDMSDLLEKSTGQVAELTGNMVDHVNDMRDELSKWVDDGLSSSSKLLTDGVEAAGKQLTENAVKAGETLISASEDSKRILVEGFLAITDSCDKTSASLTQGANQFGQTLKSSGQLLTDGIEAAGKQLTENTVNAGGKLISASEDSKKILVEGANEFGQALKGAGPVISQTVAQGIKAELSDHRAGFSTELKDHIKSQKNLWNDHEQALTGIYKSHNREVSALNGQLDSTFKHVEKELKQFESSTNRYVNGLDNDASQILQTLSRSIDEMQRIQQQLAAVQLNDLARESA